ncbi:MAG: acetyl-CoA acetyltransferase [Myxococcota bacterium]
MNGELPVVVGVGQVLQRGDDPAAAKEPLALMVEALERAGADAGAPDLPARADAVYVVRGAWGYGDAGRAVAQRLGGSPAETVGTPYGGNFAQACVVDAARQIAAGRRRIALVVGAENGRTVGQAQRQGVELVESEAPGAPDRQIAPDLPIFHDAELARGMNSASDIFAVIDSAIRHARGESLAEQTRRVSRLWAGFNAVARDNPDAWLREPKSAEQIAAAGLDNPMISSPYTRLMNANARVDMAAGLVVCALSVAREAGVPDEKIVHLHAASEANDSLYLSERLELHRSPAIRIAGQRVLDLAGTTPEGIAHWDLYSCFPSTVQVAADELRVPEGRALTVTGGLTFGGGPLNSYTLHAVARMALVMRADRGALGLVHGNGGWLAKQSLAVYGTAPPEHGFRYAKPQAEVDALPLRRARVDFEGPVTIEAYTVAHRKGSPARAIAACLTDDGSRTWATTDDPARMEAMLREEFCGRRARVDGQGGLAVDIP